MLVVKFDLGNGFGGNDVASNMSLDGFGHTELDFIGVESVGFWGGGQSCLF